MINIVSLSGGMDSATVLHCAIASGHHETLAIGFTYGSKHNPFENVMAHRLAEHYGVPFTLINLTDAFRQMRSNLMLTGDAIPEGHYEAPNMALTVIPGRNLIFAAILAGICESHGGGTIWLGTHLGDHAIYPDCRVEFIQAARLAITLSSNGIVDIATPFCRGNKFDILQYGLAHGVPYEMTRTCYKHQEKACGKCGSCQERLEAFRAAGVTDPIEYE
jgi:7-cyano-7-deazaguanine synthase